MAVAVDGGAGALMAEGLHPEAVIGDLDSLPDDLRTRLGDRLHRVEEQDTTDFDKALRHVRAPVVIAVGFTGGRFDHELAVMNTLARHPDRPCVVLGDETLAFLCPPALALHLAPGALFSVFPLAPMAATSTGLRWPLDGLALSPVGRVGTSNAVTGGDVTLGPDAPALLVILRRDSLEEVVAALAEAPRWPGP